MPQSSPPSPALKNSSAGLAFLNAYTSQEKPKLFLSVFFGSLSTVFMLVQWIAFSYMAEQVVVNKLTLTSLLYAPLIFSIALIARPILLRLQTSYSQRASLYIRANIRRAILQHWRTVSPLVIKQTSAGASATQWVDEVESMDGYFSRYWPQQLLALISPLLILFTVAYFNWLCALLLLISAPLIPVFMVLVGIGAEALNQKYSTIRQRLSGHFLDRVANLSSIKMLNAHGQVLAEVGQRSEHYRKVVMKTLKLAFLSSTVLEFFSTIAIASLAIYIGFSLYGAITWGPAHSLTLFSGLTILLLAPEFFQPLRNLSQYYHDRASALGAANNLALLLNKDGKNLSGAKHSVIKHINENANESETCKDLSLELINLRVANKAGEPLTTAFDITLKRAQRLLISGRSGSGKTTLLNTIAGYLTPESGSIRFSNNLPMPVAYLPQTVWIKNASIYNNLIVLAPKANKRQMIDVLEQLGLANELLNNHRGLDTLLGEHGQGLSGGQMQRIALARVLLNPPEILLLDEPTAKLDLFSKGLIIDALKTIQHKSITIIATHDISIIQDADVHLNLDKQAGASHAILV